VLHLPMDKELNRNDSIPGAPAGFLLDEQQWLYIKKRYYMTARELQIARLVCNGFNNNGIAEFLNIKYSTVKVHMRNIYRRVRVSSKMSLLLKFVEDINALYVSPETISSLPVPMPESISQTGSDISYKLPIKNGD